MQDEPVHRLKASWAAGTPLSCRASSGSNAVSDLEHEEDEGEGVGFKEETIANLSDHQPPIMACCVIVAFCMNRIIKGNLPSPLLLHSQIPD